MRAECQMVTASTSCTNEGCNHYEIFTKSQIDDHNIIQNCQYSCGQVNKQDTPRSRSGSLNFATKGKSTTQQCRFAFLGCHFVGNDLELAKHMEENISSHLEYVCSFLLSCSHSSHKPNVYAPTIDDNEAVKKLLAKIKCVSDEGDKTKLQAAEMQGKQKDIVFS